MRPVYGGRHRTVICPITVKLGSPAKIQGPRSDFGQPIFQSPKFGNRADQKEDFTTGNPHKSHFFVYPGQNLGKSSAGYCRNRAIKRDAQSPATSFLHLRLQRRAGPSAPQLKAV